MDDLISRQVAIDWLKSEWDGMVTSVFKGIESLPSAQPNADVIDVVRCKDCKYGKKDSLFVDGYECSVFGNSNVEADDYCSYGETKDEKIH